jgi:hypothetical protein
MICCRWMQGNLDLHAQGTPESRFCTEYVTLAVKCFPTTLQVFGCQTSLFAALMLSETFGPCHRAKMIYEAFGMYVRHAVHQFIIRGSFKLALT